MVTPSSSTAERASALDADIAAIVTEDDIPVDNIYSEKQQRLLTEPLYSGWGGPPASEQGIQRPFVAMANVGVFIDPRQPPMVPDVFVSLDVALPTEVHAREHRSYFAWEYGKVPDVVIKVVSNREGGELGVRKQRYRHIGVAWYVVWDPEHQLGPTTLQVFERRGHVYGRMKRPYFGGLGLGLTEWIGSHEGLDDRWLRWCDAEGRILLTGAERAERLAARLRALGINPEE